MKRYIVGVHNGFDVDDYYVDAESIKDACMIALSMAGDGTIYDAEEVPNSEH